MPRHSHHKPKLLDSARWRWDDADKLGYLYLPHDSTKKKLYVFTDWQTFSLLTEAFGEMRKLQQPHGVRKWLQRFKKSAPPMLKNTAFDLAIEQHKASQAETPDVLVHKPRGRIVRTSKKAEYKPGRRGRGGAVIKVMPRNLRRIKEAQDKAPVEGTEPAVEELDD